MVGSAGFGGLSPIGVQYLQTASGQRVVPVERVQLKGPLQHMEDRRQKLGLQVDRVEYRSLVDQVGKAAHAFHLRDLLTGLVALAVMNLVESPAQPGEPVRRDDLLQHEEAIGVQRLALRGRQRPG